MVRAMPRLYRTVLFVCFLFLCSFLGYLVVRNRVACILRSPGIDTRMDLMLFLSRHPSTVRLLGLRGAVSILITNPSEPTVVRCAAMTIVALGQMEACRDSLKTAVTDRDPKVAVNAAWALHRMGEPGMPEIVAGQLMNPDSTVRVEVLRILTLMRCVPNAKAVVACLKDGDHDVRAQAVYCLLMTEQTEAIPSLVALVKEERNRDVVDLANSAIKALNALTKQPRGRDR